MTRQIVTAMTCSTEPKESTMTSSVRTETEFVSAANLADLDAVVSTAVVDDEYVPAFED